MVSLGALAGSVAIAGVVALPALLPLWSGLWKYRMYRRMRETETASLGSSPRGPVAVEGTARPIDEVGTLTAPVSGTETLAYDFEVEAYMSSGTHETGTGGWTDSEQTRRTRRFRLEGTTGDAVVNPSAFDLLVDAKYRTVVEGRDEASEEVRSYVDDHDDLTLEYEHGGETHDRKLRFTEERLDPGTEVQTVGRAKDPDATAPAGVDALVAEADLSGPKKWLGQPVFVTDKSDEGAADAHYRKATQLFAIAAFWTGFCLLLGLVPLFNAL